MWYLWICLQFLFNNCQTRKSHIICKSKNVFLHHRYVPLVHKIRNLCPLSNVCFCSHGQCPLLWVTWFFFKAINFYFGHWTFIIIIKCFNIFIPHAVVSEAWPCIIHSIILSNGIQSVWWNCLFSLYWQVSTR